MFLTRTGAGALLSLLIAASAHAYTTVSILKPWVRATQPGQKVSAAYMELEASDSTHIVKLESPVAQKVELHQMTNDKGVMKMRKLDRFELPAGTTVKFEPGGLHLMLIGLKQPLKAGDTVVIKLTLRSADNKDSSLQVDASVRDDKPKPKTAR